MFSLFLIQHKTPNRVQEGSRSHINRNGEKRERKVVRAVTERNGHQYVWYEREMHKRREGKKEWQLSIEKRGGR